MYDKDKTMNTQQLFETIERITGHQCLEGEMFEIIKAAKKAERIEKLSNIEIQLHSSTVELNRVLLLLAKWLINNRLSVFKDSGIYHESKELILRKLNYSTDMLQ